MYSYEDHIKAVKLYINYDLPCCVIGSFKLPIRGCGQKPGLKQSGGCPCTRMKTVLEQ